MDADALADMVARDREEWRKLAALLDAQPGTPMHGPGWPDWRGRDIYTHFARWFDHSADDFEATLAGRGLPRPEGTDDEINARWQQEDAAVSLDDGRRLANAPSTVVSRRYRQRQRTAGTPFSTPSPTPTATSTSRLTAVTSNPP